MAESDQPDDSRGAGCDCRSWVQHEIRRLRAELARELRTARIQVGEDDGPRVLIFTKDDVAVVQVVDGAGTVSAELVASGRPADSRQAGIAVNREGNEHATLHVVVSPDGSAGECRLVFDDPLGGDGWTIVDRDGINRSD